MNGNTTLHTQDTLSLSFDRIAPIRGLLQKRSYLQSRGEKIGPAYLIFGSRTSSEGLFHDEINDFQKQGVLTKVYMCYSREMGEPKEYTTDKLQSKRVSKILRPILAEPNTHIFICGSANMAEGCKNVLREISPQGCFNTITEDGRLHCDVFGALSSRKKYSKRNQSYTLGDLVEEDGLGDLGDLDLGDLGSRFGGGMIPKRGDRSSSCIMLGNVGRSQSLALGLSKGKE